MVVLGAPDDNIGLLFQCHRNVLHNTSTASFPPALRVATKVQSALTGEGLGGGGLGLGCDEEHVMGSGTKWHHIAMSILFCAASSRFIL
jgi:hypothetical protein